jgi:RimJ/RimL family protein N-acetyltransferase
MRLESEFDSQGNPVGMPITDFDLPQLPESALFLLGQLCRLEKLEATEHAADLFAAFSLDRTNSLFTYMPHGPFQTEADYINWVLKFQHQKDPMFYAVIDLETKKAVGVAAYLRIDQRAASIEVGWITFSPLMKQKPIATEAMFLMMQYAFELGYRRYEWKCNALNKPSIQAAMRLGFSFEGVFRQATTVKGHNRDTAWFSILDSDWPRAKLAFEAWLNSNNFDQDGVQKTRLSNLTSGLLKDSWPNLTIDVSKLE